jgi:hypothetical protein
MYLWVGSLITGFKNLTAPTQLNPYKIGFEHFLTGITQPVCLFD